MVTSSWTTSSSSKMKSRSYEGGGKIPKSLTTSKHGEKVKVMCSEEVMSTGGEVIADVTRMPLEFDPALTLGHRVDVTATGKYSVVSLFRHDIVKALVTALHHFSIGVLSVQ